jgi:hypothetical protein
MLQYFTVNTSSEIICFIIALVYLSKDKDGIWRSMIIFLFITCIAELAGFHFKHLYLADRSRTHSNAWVYNILIIFQAGFLSLMFYGLLNKYVNSKGLILSGLLAVLILYTYETFQHCGLKSAPSSIDTGFYLYNDLTNTVLSVLLVIYCFYYYYCLIRDESYERFATSASFWWITGTLFFYFGTTACNIFYDKLKGIEITPKHYLTSYIYNVFNVILYGCWAYSFICKKWASKH